MPENVRKKLGKALITFVVASTGILNKFPTTNIELKKPIQNINIGSKKMEIGIIIIMMEKKLKIQ